MEKIVFLCFAFLVIGLQDDFQVSATCLRCLDVAKVACASDGRYFKCRVGLPMLNQLHACPDGKVCANVAGVCVSKAEKAPECPLCANSTDERLCPQTPTPVATITDFEIKHKKEKDDSSSEESKENSKESSEVKCPISSDTFCRTLRTIGVFEHPCNDNCRKYVKCTKKGEKYDGKTLKCPEHQIYDTATFRCIEKPAGHVC